MRILTVNSGSSSIKFALYRIVSDEQPVFSGSIGGIGSGLGWFHVKDADGKIIVEKGLRSEDHGGALMLIIEWLKSAPSGGEPDVVGHRLVHGGNKYTRSHLVDSELIETVEKLIPFAPDHLPHEISGIKEFSRSYPGVRQVACFDTAFHRTMPAAAQLYALPEEVRRQGVMRYGFHGLSYEYILGELGGEAGQQQAEGRVIIAHLGNGASMAAFRRGRSMDTTMGFTPAGGLVMSTRSGDLDPGVIVYLLKEKGMDVATLNRMINKESGLLGVSGMSSDLKNLLGAEAGNPRAAQAVGLFCYQAKKFLGALAAVLGGLDTLIFTGGIGENATSIRFRICSGLQFLGVHVDTDRNDRSAPVISIDGSPTTVRVMKTNEELMIARHTYKLIINRGENHEKK